jgi:hypothetical protein
LATINAEFHNAILAANVEALENLLDESFVWTDSTGQQINRVELLRLLKAGELKYSKLDTSEVSVSVSGDTAVVRGVSQRQRSAVPGQTSAVDSAPRKFSYTLTLVNKGGPWKAVAYHASGS